MIKTQEITLNMGPQHPSTHGVYRCILTLDGEIVTKAVNVVGYLHRGTEKLAESRTYTQVIPYTDRFDYVGAMAANVGYVEAVEKLMQLEVPERAQYIRTIMVELSRVASHMVFVGCYALDLAAFTGWMVCFRDREKILDLMEMVTGSRMTFSYPRIGGLQADIPDEFIPALKEFLADYPRMIEEYHKLISGNEILIDRSKGIGVMTQQQALDFGITGPNIRCCGLPYDLRKAPGSFYNRFNFDVPVLENGDTWDRFYYRMLEMDQSIRIIEQALEQMEEGPIMAKVPKVIKPPAGEVYHRFESTKGQIGYYIVSDGSPKPYRLHVHSPSFVNLGIFPEIVKGANIQDAVAILASIDIVLGEVDR